MRKLPVGGLVTAAILFAADQAAKYGITNSLGLNELGEGREQLLRFITSAIPAGNGSNPCPIQCECSAGFAAWLASFAVGTNFEAAERAMRQAAAQLFGGERKQIPVRAAIDNEPGWLNMDCDFRAGLNPKRFSPGRGFELIPHNIASPMHQLILVAGLAALHDQARAEMK